MRPFGMKRPFLLPCILLLAVVPVAAQDMPLSQVLIDGEGWELVGEGYEFTEAPAADPQGTVYFADVPASRIYRVGADRRVALFAAETGRTSGLMFGPDGKLYGCQNGARKIVWYDDRGMAHPIIEDIGCNDIVVDARGGIYVTDPPGKQVWYVTPEGEKRVVATGMTKNGVILWPDGGTLVVTDSLEPQLWAFRVEPDGSLKHGDRYYLPLRMPQGAERPGSDGMTVDRDGRLYVATAAGLQVFDPTGRPSGVILKPQEKSLSNVAFGGPEFNVLYVTCQDKVYRRLTKVAGVPFHSGSAGGK